MYQIVYGCMILVLEVRVNGVKCNLNYYYDGIARYSQIYLLYEKKETKSSIPSPDTKK